MSASKNSKIQDIQPIVAIGASAGGLKELKTFFDGTSPEHNLVYIVILHRMRDSDSMLEELLRPHCDFPVVQVDGKSKLEPNIVFVVPPNKKVSSIDSHIHMDKLEQDNRAPIDVLFRSLAKSHGNKSVGVILSGTGSDGTLGLKAIKEVGGLTIVQEPTSAQFDGMPQSCISTGVVDKVLEVEDMPHFIAKAFSINPTIADEYEKGKKDTQKTLDQIFSLIKRKTGRDFKRYKTTTVLRRLERRMQLHHIDDLKVYFEKLKNDSDELVALSDEFLINVTNFFRDKQVFDRLQEKVIPELVKRKENSEYIRVWSVGCATGEEAYSLAMLFIEEMERSGKNTGLQFFASDLHHGSLDKARAGFYPGDIGVDVSKARLRRFFHSEDGGYRVKKELREAIVFTPHNVLSDPPFSHLDMVVCRNLLIYLKKETQKDVFDLFHYSLQKDGYLLLGTSEHLDNTELFNIVDKETALYKKRDVQGPEPKLPVFPNTQFSMEKRKLKTSPSEFRNKGWLHFKLVEEIAPPSILLDSENAVVHLSATAGKFLGIAGGELSRDIFDLLRPELLAEVKSLIYSTRNRDGNFKSRPIKLQGKDHTTEILVTSRNTHFQNEPMLLLFFEEFETAEIKSTSSGEEDGNEQSALRILKKELAEKQRQLRTAIDEHDSGREEMKASNEELQSTNEELRSTMEELETSKEELQSMNEELITLNQENKHKVEELRQLSDDLQNLLAATDIATLFLDREFRILRFTPKLNELFNVRPADRGRKISDQTHLLGYDELVEDCENVIETLRPLEREVQDKQGRNFLTRILPYRSSDDRIDGVVITFVNISELKKAEKDLRISEQKFRALITASASLIWNTDAEGMMTKDNGAFMEYTGFTYNQVKGRNWLNAIKEEDREGLREKWDEAVEKKSDLSTEVRIYNDEAKAYCWHYLSAVSLSGKSDGQVGYVGMCIDIDDRKKSEEELKKAKDRAEIAAQAREDFLAHMSHEIRTPLNSIIGLSHLIEEAGLPEEQMEMIQTLKLSSEHLKKLITDILDLSKLRAGKVLVIAERVDLKNLIDEVVSIHRYSAEAKGIRLKLDYPKELNTVYKVDRLKLSQVLHNLLSNAIKFTDEGEVKLTLKLLEKSARQHLVHFEVKDTGIGIAKDKLKAVFENFGQADSSTTRLYGGTGLGLTLCKHYLEVMDSEINLKSIKGNGATFSFDLNLPVGNKKPVEKSDDRGLDGRLAKNLNVLVVDDSGINRAVMKAFLNRFDHITLEEASGGQEAIDMAKKSDFDLILMDIRMPELDGFQATTEIRNLERYKRIPIVAVTADVSPKVQERVKEGLFSDFMAKPVEPDDLTRVLLTYSAISKKRYNTASQTAKTFSQLHDFLNGDEEKAIEILESAREALDEIKAELRKVRNEGNAKALEDLRHKHKWMLELLGFVELIRHLQSDTLFEDSLSEKKKKAVDQKSEGLIEEANKKIVDHLFPEGISGDHS
ncbi:MAG TPA: CheR family methyltransferase [Cryomorphaceae bacterium]|nr:CheR family methyltransferase [Cryomorphaceae bacterium]